MDDARPGTALLLALLGALLGTLITLLLDTTPTVRAIGAILGAFIPTLVGHVGPWRYPRAAAGIGVTVGALFITYGGFTAFDYAADKEETFPIPNVMPAPNPPPPPTLPPIVTTENGLSLVVSPNKVQCGGDGCDEVTVTSTGAEIVQIGGIELVGEAADDFGYGGSCEQGPLLQKGETCGVTVSFKPSGTSGTRTATLVIHHNVGPDPSNVPVEGEVEGGGPPPPSPPALGDLIPVQDSVECLHQEGGARVNGELENALQIFFVLRLEGADPKDLPGFVLIRAQSSRGTSASPRVGVEGRVVAAIPLGASDYGRVHSVTVRVDPNREVPESNDGNNQFRVRVFVPVHPASTQPLPC